jgi:TctA family transporter
LTSTYAATNWQIKDMTLGLFRIILGIKTSHTQFAIPAQRQVDLKIFGGKFYKKSVYSYVKL